MATAKKADQAKSTYRVISPLDHDQERYAIGDDVELTEDLAKPLLGHTVVPKNAEAKAA